MMTDIFLNGNLACTSVVVANLTTRDLIMGNTKHLGKFEK